LTPATILITTPRLELSDFHAEDYDDFQGLFRDLHYAGQDWHNVDFKKPETVQAFFDKILANQEEIPRHTYRLAVRLRISEGISKVIGYVSLCDVHALDDSRPDTGILINPLYQGHNYAREARLAIGYFGFRHLGLPKLVCDIWEDNSVSISNVRGMGYRQLYNPDQTPVLIPTPTHRGLQDWFRFHLTSPEFNTLLPHLLDHLAKRHWHAHMPTLFDAKEFFKIHVYEGPSRLQRSLGGSVPLPLELAND
jgi:RimJ/RimL family protein N-acetyltransferase